VKNIAILGSSWGDEGKGHITHAFSKNYDWVIRFNGGANAGHTIYREISFGVNQKYVHNLLPSFDWREPDLKCFLAQGMVIDLEQLFNEIMNVEHEFVTTWGYSFGEFAKRVFVDPDAFVVLPEHKEEDKRSNGHIGSTNRGIGPAYKSKISRSGKRVKDLLNDKEMWATKLKEIGVNFRHVLELKHEFENKKLLFEGAQGIMLDINHGTYPFVSCSDATVAGIYSSGFNFVKLDEVFGVAKAYLTKVGEGPFPTEIHGEEAEVLRKLGNEYGATTGRPRRIGWFDLPALRYACDKGGITSLIITKLDILNGYSPIKLCAAYEKIPVCPQDFFSAKPQLISFPGWRNPKNQLETANFITYISSYVGRPVKYISCGVNTSDIMRW
jgi:adenylosuccinate synthase